MEFGGRYRLDAPRVVVWAALNDAEKLKAAIPGCRKLEWSGEHTLDMELKVDFGVVHPVFRGELRLDDIVPATSYTLSGRGVGGLLGKAQGAARISLSDADGGTELSFVADGGADSAIMKLGRALLGKTAQRVIDNFFERFGATIGAIVIPMPPPDGG